MTHISLRLRVAQNGNHVAIGGTADYGTLRFDSLSIHVEGDTANFELVLIPADEAYLKNLPAEEKLTQLFSVSQRLRNATLTVKTPTGNLTFLLPMGS